MYIVGFNGPPQSGKDTLARLLADHMDQQGVQAPVLTEHLSWPLRSIAYAMVGLIYENTTATGGMDYEEFKQTLFPQFGCTGRQLMIDVSEKFLKPVYNREIMAKMLISRLSNAPDNTVILLGDTGFQLEVMPLIERYGADRVCIVKVIRPGCDFSNDSREWVDHPFPAQNMDIYNTTDLDGLKVEAGRIYGRLVNRMGWKL